MAGIEGEEDGREGGGPVVFERGWGLMSRRLEERVEGQLEKRSRSSDTVRLSTGAASGLKFGDGIAGIPKA